jgi:curved DNA-binding protein CbpA
MTDYFALLEQPRAPWLDPAALKETYHRKTLQTHPDTAAPDRENDFTGLNEAYQVLQDPKRRLHHLLSLENCAPTSANQPIPGELQDLFLLIGALNQRANLLLKKTRTTSNALSRSLLKPQIVELQNEVCNLRNQVQRCRNSISGSPISAAGRHNWMNWLSSCRPDKRFSVAPG